MNNRIKENEQQITYLKLESLLKHAYKSKAKISDDPIHEEVTCTVYCGAGFNVHITATGYEDDDAAGKVCFYVSQQFEDEIGEMNMGENLKQTIKDLYQMASDISEMEERPYIEDTEIRKLEDIVNGQSLLFENMIEKRMNNRINERRISKGEHNITLSDVEKLFDSLGIDDYDVNKNLQKRYINILFNDQNYSLHLTLRFHDADWTTYNLWFDNDNNKPEWRGCSIQELREDLEDMISCLD